MNKKIFAKQMIKCYFCTVLQSADMVKSYSHWWYDFPSQFDNKARYCEQGETLTN